jgi:hypothetical protein
MGSIRIGKLNFMYVTYNLSASIIFRFIALNRKRFQRKNDKKKDSIK